MSEEQTDRKRRSTRRPRDEESSDSKIAQESQPTGVARDDAQSGRKNTSPPSSMDSSNDKQSEGKDKDKKEGLTDKVMDKAIDAVPYLGQINSARKALKRVKEGMDDKKGKGSSDIDKKEEEDDDFVDKAKKGAKYTLVAGLAAQGTLHAMAMLMFLKMLMLIKNAVMSAVAKFVGFFGKIFSAISNVVSSVLGVGAMVGNIVASGVIALATTFTAVVGGSVIATTLNKDDGAIIGACEPDNTDVSKAVIEYKLDGETKALQEDTVRKLWSVFSAMGATKEQAAAVIANFEGESGLDPTTIETIYDEPYQIGPRKQDAINADFKLYTFNPNAYGGKYKDNIEYAGTGIGQWTNGRQRMLIEYADQKKQPWYQLETQIKFMLEADDKTRVKFIHDLLTGKLDVSSVEDLTEVFQRKWEGLNDEAEIVERQGYAVNWLSFLEYETADISYGNSILNDVNVDRAEGNDNGAKFYEDDGCGGQVRDHYAGAVDGTGQVPPDLINFAWRPEDVPNTLREYIKDPRDVGMEYLGPKGWETATYPDQCAAFSHAYFMKLYPNWNKNGRPTTRAYGDGKDVARNWAKHYGETVTKVPQAGAVFSDSSTSVWGHTGVVVHVFANGDILIAEQNYPGLSGEGAGISHSWNYRIVRKSNYMLNGYEFFKPKDEQPMWVHNQ